MIDKIDIENFGSFSKFQWDLEVLEPHGAVGKFKKLNILYGRNYSGKTTLSRIFRSFEVGKTPARFDGPSFKIKTDGGLWSQEQLIVQGSPIRVYNRDFVESNLAFLRDEDGRITPFAILGEENKEVELQIEEINKKLGSKDSDTGLRANYAKKQEEIKKSKALIEDKNGTLNKKLIDKANGRPRGIKHNPIYKSPYYDVRNLNADIDKVISQNVAPLEEAVRSEKIGLLAESALSEVKGTLQFLPGIEILWQSAREVSGQKIKPSAPLQDLLNSAALAQWVKAGMTLHADRETCAFCRQSLPADIWTALNGHFNEESESLQQKIGKIIGQVDAEKAKLSQLRLPGREHFYSIFHEKYDELTVQINAALLEYAAALERVESLLRERSENIFSDKQVEDASFDCVVEIARLLEGINLLASANNKHTEQLGSTHKMLREELRLSEVAAFIFDINIEEERRSIKAQEERERSLATELEEIRNEGKRLSTELEALQARLRDEKRGAEQVNRYLGHSLGGTNLRLLAEEQEDQKTYRFRIMRGDREAYNLSEGECSLVAFCYFLARLDDVQTKGTNPIIYIDDPISSLDSNHIFFIYSLIETFIAKPLRGDDGKNLKDAAGNDLFRYEQLFISTHNLEFLKYLKRLSKPKQVEKFIITRKNDSSSIELMPKYLRKYITELNYLFSEVYTCMDAEKSATSYHSFYNFGNNLRKFLEAFLFFKYPSADVSNDDRLCIFFGDSDSGVEFVRRLTNEHSHLEDFVDRGMAPIDCAGISKAASFVLETMRQRDPVQYEHFLKSIDAVDPLPAVQGPVTGRP